MVYNFEDTLKTIKHFINKLQRNIADASSFVTNGNLHRDLETVLANNEIQMCIRKHEETLHHHVNAQAIQMLHNADMVRRRTSFELVSFR